MKLIKWRYWVVIVFLAACSGVFAARYLGRQGTGQGSPAATARGADICSLNSGVWFNVERPLRWESLKGRPILLEFWSSWCAPCLKQIPRLNLLQRKFEDRGLVIIGVTSENAQKAYEFAKRFNIEYAVCANQRSVGVKALPTAFLIDGQGKVIFKVVGELSGRELETTLENLPKSNLQNLIHKGVTPGFASNRPAFVAAYDQAALSIEVDGFIAQIESGNSSNVEKGLEKLFSFYYKNLPTAQWPGDMDCRLFLVGSVFDLLDCLKNHSLESGIARLQEEMVRVSRTSEPEWLVRSQVAATMGKAFRVGDLVAIEALSEREKVEKNPLVKHKIVESLSRLDKSRPAVVRPPSAWAQASANYNAALREWKTRLFGLRGDYAAYDTYVKNTEAFMAAQTPALAVEKLMSDFDQHRGQAEHDLLIRYYILDQAGGFPYTYSVTQDEQCRIQKWLFSEFKREEPDWQLRLKTFLALDATIEEWKFGCLERDQVAAAMEERIRSEEVPYVRAHLEFGRMQILNP